MVGSTHESRNGNQCDAECAVGDVIRSMIHIALSTEGACTGKAVVQQVPFLGLLWQADAFAIDPCLAVSMPDTTLRPRSKRHRTQCCCTSSRVNFRALNPSETCTSIGSCVHDGCKLLGCSGHPQVQSCCHPLKHRGTDHASFLSLPAHTTPLTSNPARRPAFS